MWCADFGDAVVHPDFPSVAVEEPVMEPAQQDAVVGVGRATPGVFEDMMNFAPRGGDAASGDEAAAVTERDRATLPTVEDPLFGAERVDPAGVGLDLHPHDHTRAAGVPCWRRC